MAWNCMLMFDLMLTVYMIAIKWLQPSCMQLEMYALGGEVAHDSSNPS